MSKKKAGTQKRVKDKRKAHKKSTSTKSKKKVSKPLSSTAKSKVKTAVKSKENANPNVETISKLLRAKRKLNKSALEIKGYFLKHYKKSYLVILTLIIGIGLLSASAYLLFAPYVPELIFKINPPDNSINYEISESVKELLKGSEVRQSEELAPIPSENRIVIPEIGVDAEIFNAPSLDILNEYEGVWREPWSSTPVDSGTTVIAGHRFQYLPPNMVTFYNLDKLKPSDRFVVFWNKKEYVYEVSEVFEVQPEEISIREDKGYSRLVLYTCTPLGTSSKRLVVDAKQIQ